MSYPYPSTPPPSSSSSSSSSSSAPSYQYQYQYNNDNNQNTPQAPYTPYLPPTIPSYSSYTPSPSPSYPSPSPSPSPSPFPPLSSSPSPLPSYDQYDYSQYSSSNYNQNININNNGNIPQISNNNYPNSLPPSSAYPSQTPSLSSSLPSSSYSSSFSDISLSPSSSSTFFPSSLPSYSYPPPFSPLSPSPPSFSPLSPLLYDSQDHRFVTQMDHNTSFSLLNDKTIMDKYPLPVGGIIHPLAFFPYHHSDPNSTDNPNIPSNDYIPPHLLTSPPPRCLHCHSYYNSYNSYKDHSQQWQCVICQNLNNCNGVEDVEWIEGMRGMEKNYKERGNGNVGGNDSITQDFIIAPSLSVSPTPSSLPLDYRHFTIIIDSYFPYASLSSISKSLYSTLSSLSSTPSDRILLTLLSYDSVVRVYNVQIGEIVVSRNYSGRGIVGREMVNQMYYKFSKYNQNNSSGSSMLPLCVGNVSDHLDNFITSIQSIGGGKKSKKSHHYDDDYEDDDDDDTLLLRPRCLGPTLLLALEIISRTKSLLSSLPHLQQQRITYDPTFLIFTCGEPDYGVGSRNFDYEMWKDEREEERKREKMKNGKEKENENENHDIVTITDQVMSTLSSSSSPSAFYHSLSIHSLPLLLRSFLFSISAIPIHFSLLKPFISPSGGFIYSYPSLSNYNIGHKENHNENIMEMREINSLNRLELDIQKSIAPEMGEKFSGEYYWVGSKELYVENIIGAVRKRMGRRVNKDKESNDGKSAPPALSFPILFPLHLRSDQSLTILFSSDFIPHHTPSLYIQFTSLYTLSPYHPLYSSYHSCQYMRIYTKRYPVTGSVKSFLSSVDPVVTTICIAKSVVVSMQRMMKGKEEEEMEGTGGRKGKGSGLSWEESSEKGRRKVDDIIRNITKFVYEQSKQVDNGLSSPSLLLSILQGKLPFNLLSSPPPLPPSLLPLPLHLYHFRRSPLLGILYQSVDDIIISHMNFLCMAYASASTLLIPNIYSYDFAEYMKRINEQNAVMIPPPMTTSPATTFSFRRSLILLYDHYHEIILFSGKNTESSSYNLYREVFIPPLLSILKNRYPTPIIHGIYQSNKSTNRILLAKLAPVHNGWRKRRNEEFLRYLYGDKREEWGEEEMRRMVADCPPTEEVEFVEYMDDIFGYKGGDEEEEEERKENGGFL